MGGTDKGREGAVGGSVAQHAALGLLLLGFVVWAAWFAHYAPGHGRFYDERFAFQNVHAVMERGTLSPANGYYPTLSYLPQTLIIAGLDRLLTAPDDGRWAYVGEVPPAHALPPRAGAAFSAGAYRVARAIQVIWGLLALVALARLGRRCFDQATGLLAAIMLATSPWFIVSAGKFKPDVALLATALLALLASSHAVARPLRWRPYLLAGVAIAAAMSCKPTGGLVAVPLALVTLVQVLRDRDPRRLLALTAAGSISLALYLVANPHVGMTLHFMERLSKEYADKALAYGGTRLGVAARSLELVVDRTGFGPLLGTFALAGWAALLVGLVVASRNRRRVASRRPDQDAEDAARAGRWLVVLFPPLYLVAYAAKTPHFKANNVLPILPPLALIGAWAALATWRWLADRVARHLRRGDPGGRWRQGAAVLLGTVIAGMLVHGAWTFAYESTVPTTHDHARLWLTRNSGRVPVHLLAPPPPEERYAWEGRHHGAGRELARFPLAARDLVASPAAVDGVLSNVASPAAAVDETARPTAATPADPTRADAPITLRQTFAPRLGEARGPRLTLVAAPWRHKSKPYAATVVRAEGGLTIAWPQEAPPGWYSLELWLPPQAAEVFPAQAEIDGRSVPMAWLRRAHGAGGGVLFTTPRFVTVSPRIVPPSLRVAVPDRGADRIRAALYRWLPPEGSVPHRQALRPGRAAGADVNR